MNIAIKSRAALARLIIGVAALFLCATIVSFGFASANLGAVVFGLAMLTLISCSLRKGSSNLFAVTLTVPEILTDVMDAFKLETPEIFGANGIATDFTTATQVLGDTVTAKIAKVPVTGAYDRNNGGFKNAAQNAEGLFEDVPVKLDQFRIVTINVNWLTQLASKIELYQETMRNNGYALTKYVLDAILAKLLPVNFSNGLAIPLANVNLDTIDVDVRQQMNIQKMADTGRFMICNTPFASKFGSDDRVRNTQYGIDQKNSQRGYRRWAAIGGMSWIREYPDFPDNGITLQAVAAEKRGIVMAARAMSFSNVAEQLGITKVMDFYPMEDSSGLHMTGAAWQEAGTGDVYVSAGVLFGISVGRQGGAVGSITDNGGLLITKQ